MCIYGETTPCIHLECHQPHLPFPVSFPRESLLIHKLYEMLQAQNQELQKVFDTNRLLTNSLLILSERLQNPQHQSEPSVPFTSSPNDILDQILREDSFQYSILLIDSLPSIILKEKGFQLTVGLLDQHQNRIQIPNDFKFKVELYTMDMPAKLLEVNIHGKKILRGTLVSMTMDNSTVMFSNIVINEVSSHYSNDSLKIVVQLIGSHLVKPLVINNISVRARKNTISRI